MRSNLLHSCVPVFCALCFGVTLATSACQAKEAAPPTPEVRPALDEFGIPENFCRGGFFAKSEQLRLAKVVGANTTRAYFYYDPLREGCPNVSLEKCKEKSYLIPGDQLVVSKTYGNFICGWYSPAKGSPTVSWLLLSDLEITAPDAAPSPDKWAGTWSAYSSHSITIKNEATGSLWMRGEASWTGITGSVHIGNFNGSTRPQGNQATLDDGLCKVNFILVGGYLVANDNSRCGGANVSFDGVYWRKKQAEYRK